MADTIDENDTLPIGAAELLDDLPDAVVIARPDLSIEYVNAAGLELLGYEHAEVEQLNLVNLVDVTELAENPLQLDRIREGRPNLNTRRLLRKDGTPVPVEINAKLLGNGSLRFVGRDVSDRLEAARRIDEALAEARAAAEASREREERIRALFERTTVPISLSDLDDRITAVNPAFAELLGHDADEIVGHQYAEFSHPDDLARSAEVGRLARELNEHGEAPSVRFEKRYVAAGGETEWCDVTVSPLYDQQGTLQGHVVVTVPINDAKEAQEAQHRRADELAALVAIGQTVLSSDTTDEILAGTLGHLDPLLSCIGISVSEIKPEQKVARLIAAVGAIAHARPLGEERPILGTIDDLIAGWSRTVPDLDAEPPSPILDGLRAIGAKSAVFVPLKAGGELFGALSLALGEPGGLQLEELAFVEHAASTLGLALRHAQLREALERSAEELTARVDERTADLANALAGAEREQALLRAVLDAAPDTIQAVDLEGNVLFSNESAELVSALSGEDEATEPIDPGEATLREVRVADGSRVVSHYAAPIRQSGHIIGRLNVIHDVTAERQAEQLKDDLLATVSHELRTPVTSIAGFAELLGHPGLSAEKRDRYISYVHNESQRLIAVVNDLLDLQLIERTNLELEPAEIDLRALAEEVADVQRRSTGGTVELVDESPAIARCDRARVRQVIENLVVNAIKYSDGAPVSLRVIDLGDTVRVEVRDQGPGIPLAERGHVFERFFRGRDARMRRIRGTGIGLALCREIVRAHGGTIDVISDGHDGSTFWFELPKEAPR